MSSQDSNSSKVRHISSTITQLLYQILLCSLLTGTCAYANTNVEVFPQIFHSGGVEALAISRDNKFILSGSFDKTLKLWDVASGREIRTLKGHLDSVRTVIFTSDNRFALSGGDKGELIYWNMESGEIFWKLKTLGSIQSLAVNSGGNRVLAGRVEDVVLFDIASGKELHRFKYNDRLSIDSVAFSPDGNLALAGSSTGPKSNTSITKLWDVKSGREIRTFIGDNDPIVNSVAFSPDGRSAISSGSETIKVWDVASGQLLKKRFVTQICAK